MVGTWISSICYYTVSLLLVLFFFFFPGPVATALAWSELSRNPFNTLFISIQSFYLFWQKKKSVAEFVLHAGLPHLLCIPPKFSPLKSLPSPSNYNINPSQKKTKKKVNRLSKGCSQFFFFFFNNSRFSLKCLFLIKLLMGPDSLSLGWIRRWPLLFGTITKKIKKKKKKKKKRIFYVSLVPSFHPQVKTPYYNRSLTIEIQLVFQYLISPHINFDFVSKAFYF